MNDNQQNITLSARDLSKYYDKRSVVEGVSFEIHPGEILGFLGANGAGKSTTVGMLYGSVVPTRGYVQIGDYHVQKDGRKARKLMGIVTQDDNLDPDFTVIDNLINFAHHYRITGHAARVRAGELLERVGLTDRAKSRIDELSGGLKRRLVLARALIDRPAIVFLDEPTTGLDPHARQDFWRLVGDLKDSGCGVLLTTHYMDEAQRLCDRLLLLQQGRAIDEGNPAEIIARTVGAEVVEVSGISVHELERLTNVSDTWCLPFGSNYLIAVPQADSDLFFKKLNELQPVTLDRRRANLEDVFLKLTGKLLD
jgi:lipooligosaccharide transport system ATP-binding protein